MTATQQIQWLLSAAILAPLVSAVLVLLATQKLMNRSAAWLTTAVMFGSLALCALASYIWIDNGLTGAIVVNLHWIPLPGTQAGWIDVGLLADSLTVLMMTLVTLIASLVHLYSMGYMAGDSRYPRFFAYLSLFAFSMLGLVAANSLIMLLVFWELVGLTSYLLIGFWFEQRGPQQASKKAFVMNRIGDTGFVIGIGILFYNLGGQLLLPATGAAVDGGNLFAGVLQAISAEGLSVAHPPLWLTLAGIALLFGAIGKSAQFPLHTWLPDAMEGPTPVSSMVHSATMVAAGVYLVARLYPILTPGVHLFIVVVGLITLIIGGCMALVMTDIKRVLAYSTMSQLGYMMLGMGVGAYIFALYHLVAHALFKCCLFQCSGSVIHGCQNQRDMRQYGGLWRKMPITAICYGVCTLAIAGASIPMTAWGLSGFYSKDGILAGAANYAGALEGVLTRSSIFWLGPAAMAYITSLYMARSFALTFLGRPRDMAVYQHAHEAPWQMLISQVVLAVFTVAAVPALILDPIVGSMPMVSYIQPDAVSEVANGTLTYGRIEQLMDPGFGQVHLALGLGFGWLVMLIIGLAVYWHGVSVSSRLVKWPVVGGLHRLFLNKFYMDAFYDVAVVGAVKLLAVLLATLDRFVVDGVVNLIASVVDQLSDLLGRIDNNRQEPANAQEAFIVKPGRTRVYLMMTMLAGVLMVFVLLGAMILYR